MLIRLGRRPPRKHSVSNRKKKHIIMILETCQREKSSGVSQSEILKGPARLKRVIEIVFTPLVTDFPTLTSKILWL